MSNFTTPRPEHPRPDLYRDMHSGWASLHGPWSFRFDPGDRGLQDGWQNLDDGVFEDTIIVPFPWESHSAWGTEILAGNENWFSTCAFLTPSSVTVDNYTVMPRHTVGWYRRTVTVPARGEDERLWLHIGAADWEVSVWVNGQPVAEGRSGYVPFSCDITEAVGTDAAEAAITIRVHDPQGTEDRPLGKQHKWYTTTSGIWQPVWLEVRPERHVTQVHVIPHLEPARVECRVALNCETDGLTCRVVLTDEQGAVAGEATAGASEGNIAVPLTAAPVLWSPDNPHLYDVTVQLMDGQRQLDEVHTQVGLRTVGVAPLHAAGPKYITLNGKPIYLKGALDQSFNPRGVYAWASDEDMIRDLELAKEAGFNFLRIHIKPEDPRFLYWADRLGMLIMYDFPNLGYDGYGETGCERWEWTFRELLARDFNHPCIFSWVLFNETWGLGFGKYAEAPERQEWVKQMFRLAKELDPSRLIEDNSACSYDHVLTDINSWHFYINDYAKAREHVEKVVRETYSGSGFNYVGGNVQGDEPLLNSEYGGISARQGDLDVSWCFKFLTDLLRRQEKVCGYVYTELQDIEWEYNGIYNYDRSPKEFGYPVKALQGPLYLGFDCPPAQTVGPDTTLLLPMFINRAGFTHEVGEFTYRVTAIDSLGQDSILVPITVLPLDLAHAGTLGTFELPELLTPTQPCLLYVQARLAGQAGNWCYLEVRDAALPREERLADGRVVLRKLAGDVEVSTAWHEAEVERGVVDYETHLFGGVEAGHMDYLFTLPEDVSLSQTQSLTFVCEASSKRPGAPQTSGEPWPSDLTISMNGVAVHQVTLRDQYADSRGALSHLHGFRGRYGELIRVEVSGELLEQVRAQDPKQVLVRLEVPRSALNHRGLTVYSSRAGSAPCDVTLVVS